MPTNNPKHCPICLGQGTADEQPGADPCSRCRGTGFAPACLDCQTPLTEDERLAAGNGVWQCAPCCEFEAADEREYADLAVAS